jgi:hypothetical protein
MKSVKSFLLFFAVYLASITIIFDWGDYTYDIAYKYTHKVIADKHEQLSNQTIQSYRRVFLLSPHNQSKKDEDNGSNQHFGLDTSKFYNNVVINVRCAVKSYLHLLHLF